MISFLQRLFAHPRSGVRAVLTPGRLYAAMSAEFKAGRSSECFTCTMPLPFTCERENPAACNWRIQRLASDCEDCARLAQRIAHKYAAAYDVRDPFWSGDNKAHWDDEPFEHHQFG